MADRKRETPDWFDLFGLRGSIWDPLGLMSDAARVLSPPTRSFSWVATAVARRLEGRRFELQGEPAFSGRVGRIDEVVPSATIPVPKQDSSVRLWDRVRFSIDHVSFGLRPIERVDVVATDIRISATTGQRLSAALVDFAVTLTESQLTCWIDGTDIDAEFDFATATVVVRQQRLGRWISVVMEPVLQGREFQLRPISVRLSRWDIPVPARLTRSRCRHLRPLPPEVEFSGMRVSGKHHLEVCLVGRDLDLAVDLPRLITEIGVDGTRSIVKVFGIQS